MSWRASAWAKEQRLGSPAAKSILLCLADYADPEKAECWPSQTQLASDAEVSERTAREWLQRLEDWGLIGRERRTRSNGARASDMIVLKLDARVRDGLERCRDIKAGADDADESLPADSAGRSYRQPDADPTGNEQQPTGNQCRAYKEEPSIEPTKGTSQLARQGAGESADDGLGKEDRKKIEAAFWRIVKDWPNFAGMPKEPAKKPFLALSADERTEAERKFPHWLALLKAQGKSHIPAPSTYFGEKLWQAVPEPKVEQPTSIDAPVFGPVWSAMRFREFSNPPEAGPPVRGFMAEQLARTDDAGRLARLSRQATYGWPGVNRMHDRALSRRGISVAPQRAALAELMEPVKVGSDLFERWRVEHEQRGWPWLPDPGAMPVVYFPKGGPEGLDEFQAAVRNGDDGDRREAAE